MAARIQSLAKSRVNFRAACMSAPDDAVAFYQEVLASPEPRWSSTSAGVTDDHATPWPPVARPSYQPARVNVPWLIHLAAGEPSGARPGAALDRQPVLRALAAALPELVLFVEPPLVARGVPGEAFVGATHWRSGVATLSF